MCVSRSVLIGGRMQERKCMCKKGKGISVGDEASSTRGDVNEKNKIRNKGKVVVCSISKDESGSISSSSSNEVVVEKRKIYSCASCPREFSCQHAYAGHRNTHRREWVARSMMPGNDGDDGKIQLHKFPCHPGLSPFPSFTNGLKQKSVGESSSKPIDVSSAIDKLLLSAPQYPLANPTNTLKRPSPNRLDNPTNTIKYTSSKHTSVRPTNTMKGPSPRHSMSFSKCFVKVPSSKYTLVNPTDTPKTLSPGYPSANPTNTINRPPGAAPRNIYANPSNTLIGPSLGAPHLSFFGPTNTLHMPPIQYLNHPHNFTKPQDSSALGVKRESMIHKPYQGRQLGGSTSFGKQQVIGGNVRLYGSNSNFVDLTSSSTTEGSASSSRTEGRVNSNSHDSSSLSFESRGGKWVEVPELYLRTPPQKRRNHDIDHSSQVIAPKLDNNGEDIDLDLKL